MNYQFYFGPDKVPFCISKSGMVEQDSTMPFHGIISRGLLNSFIKADLPYLLWSKYALQIEDNLADNNTTTSEELDTLKELAEQCHVLKFGQSAYCVQLYLEKYFNKKKNSCVECWNIKEGHTSSVWKITIATKNKPRVFVLNVARDNEAGIELKESSLKLKKIGEQNSETSIAKVYDIQVLQNIDLPCAVVVTRNQWIENAKEIHTRVNKQTTNEELLLVDRFLTSADTPAQITSVLGRVFTKQEFKKIKTEINIFLSQAATCLPFTPQLNINDGDVVWNGKKAVIVAIS